MLAAVWSGLVGCHKNKSDQAMENLARGRFAFSVEEFHRAAREGNAGMVDQFLAAGMAVDVKDAAGRTPLGTACEANGTDAVLALLKAGAAVSQPQPGGRTALMLAAEFGSDRLVRVLLENGADPKQTDPEGWTPLGIAVWNGRKDPASVLAAQATTDEIDKCLLLAALRGDVALTDMLLRRGASVMAKDKEGRTPLMLAARGGHSEVVDLLLNNGASRFALQESTGRTAGQLAAAAGDSAEERKDPDLAARCRELATALSAPPKAGEESGVFSDPRPVVALALAKEDENLAAAADSGKVRLAEPLDKATLPARSAGLEAVGKSIRLAEYRERPMPVMLESVAADGRTARFRRLYAPHDSVEAGSGAVLPGTTWKVVEVKRKMGSAKDDGSPIELSTVTLEPEGGGASRRLAAGNEALAEEPVVVVQIADNGPLLVGHRGDTFQLANDPATYRVIDIGPEQLVIEEAATGKTTTLKRR